MCIHPNRNSSESIRKNYSISFDVIRSKIRFNPRFLILIKIQSDSIRDFKSEWIRGQNDLNWILNSNNSDLGFIRIEKLIRIHSDLKSRIKSDRFSTDLHKTRLKTFSDWLEWIPIGSNTNFGINRIGLE